MRELGHQGKRLRSWLAANDARARPIAVTLGGSSNGLSFARSLGRRGVPVLMIESERSLGTYTRYANAVLLPPAEEAPEAWIDLLELVGSRLSKPGVLFPTGDDHTLLVSRHRDVLDRRFRLVVPGPETVERIVNKRLQYGVAQATGIPVPRAYFPESDEELRRLSGALPYPVLLKPYESHVARRTMGRKVIVVASETELVSAYAEFAERDLPVMVQEIVPGDDTTLFGYLAFFDEEGVEVAWLTKQKLRQHPAQFGDGSLQVTVDAPEVAALSRRLLGAFDVRGFVGVEFKRDARSGTYYLMEINPRTVSGNQLAISAGVDFPWIGYQYLTGSRPDTSHDPPFRLHVTYVNEALDVFAYAALRKSRAMSLRHWLGSLRGATARAIWARDDPLPLIIGLSRLAFSLVTRRAR